MLELLERFREQARAEVEQIEEQRKEIKGKLGILGARQMVLGARLQLLNELRVECEQIEISKSEQDKQ